MRRIRKIMCVALALIMLINSNIIVNAATDISVNVVTNPKVDIMLTSKDTETNLDNFEADVLKSLQNKGINTSNIEFTTVERNLIDTSTSDALTIFNSWTTFPYNIASNWYYVSNGGYITSNVNEPYETGFIDKNSGYVQDVTLTAKLFTNQYNQPMGYIVRMTPQPGNANRYNMYMLWISGWDGYNYTSPNLSSSNATGGVYYTAPQRSIALFKVEGLILDYNIWKNYATSGTYSATPLCQTMYNGVLKLGWPYHLPRAYGGYPDNTNLTNGIKVSNVGDSGLKTTTLAYAYMPLGNNDIFNMKLDVKGDTFKAYYNDTLLFTAQDSSYSEGYYGVFEYSHVSPRFYGISVETANTKTYKEVLLEPKWRDDAKHVVVNVDDTIDETLTGTSTIGEILSRTLADDIHFIQWGTNTNKSATTNFIAQNDNKGKFTYNTNYNQAVEDTANYIKNLITQETNSQYVIVGQDTSLIVTPESYKTGATSTDFPNGRWKIHHNYTYYDNNLGQSNQTEIYSPNLMCNFDKPGEYIIYFDNQEVKKVYAHRKPIADFDIGISGTTLSLTSTSYDLDKSTDKGYGPGIASEKWYYKEATATSWSNGKLTTFNRNKIYVIKLEVTDLQGASSYTTKYVGTGNPVASFNYGSNTISKYKQLTITDTSYDPEGYAITGYSWVLKKNNIIIGTYTTPITNFNTNSLGLGNYSYTLTVTNSKGTKSEAFTKNFTVIDDTDKPEVIVNPTSCTWKGSQVVSLAFSDADSGFKNWRYCSTTSQTPPTSGWSSWNTNANSTATVTGSTTGEYYLHLQAYDNAGNLLERSVGLYQIDKTKPVVVKLASAKTAVNQNKITVTATDDHSGMYQYAISTTATQPTNFQTSNVLTATQLGTHYIWAKDNAGNVGYTTYNVTDMDFSITTTCGTQGTISNYSIVKSHQSTSIVIIPAVGFKIKDVVVDGTSKGAVNVYDFWDVTTSHSVSATFERDTKITTILNNLKTKYDWITFK